jgi:hypothetical protein
MEQGEMIKSAQWVLIWVFIAVLAATGAAENEAVHIYGIHSWGDGANGIMNGKTGWTVEVVNTDPFGADLTPDQAQRIVNEGFTLIIRINKIFGTTVPTNPSEYDAFAAACAAKVTTFQNYCHRWIIGNEMNADFEGNIPAGNYITLYQKCRTQIHAVQPEAEVLVAAVAPWNSSQKPSGPYGSSCWLNYMYQLVNTLGDEADGYAIHAYGGRGGDSDPRDDSDWGFGVFKRWMEIIDANAFARTKPVYLTEMNHAADGQGSTAGYPKYPYPAGYIQRLFQAINTWNIGNAHKIRCAAWFAYANGGFPGYDITLNSQMRDDFSAATRDTNYTFLTPTPTPLPASASRWTSY